MKPLARAKPGWAVYRATAGHVAVSLHYSADPEKNSMEWAESRRKLMPDEPAYLQEYEISWTSSSGNPVFPEAANNIMRYVAPGAHAIPGMPVFRGWDFGARNPACVWGQVQDGQVVILHEVVPPDIDIHSYVELVKYLSGQGELTRPRAIQWTETLVAARPWFPEGDPYRKAYPVPFFPQGCTFRDFCGPEVTQPSAFESTRAERSAQDVLGSAGIEIEWNATPQAFGENIIRRLLLDMDTDKPGLAIHPSCTTLLEALGGALAWKPPTKSDPRPNQIRRVPGYIDVYDAFRYMIINLADVVTRVHEYERRLDAPPVVDEKLQPRAGWPVEQLFHGIEFNEVTNSREAGRDWLD